VLAAASCFPICLKNDGQRPLSYKNGRTTRCGKRFNSTLNAFIYLLNPPSDVKMPGPDLFEFLQAHYTAGPFELAAQLQTNGQREAYALRSPSGSFVVKVTDPGRPESVVRADVGTPQVLCAAGFPAPRPLPARDGRLYLPYGDRFVYVYEYIEGSHPTPRDDFYPRLGALLARLHAIPPSPEVPRSEYRPPNILAEARESLLRINSFVGDPGDLTLAARQAILPELLAMIDRFPSFDGLPVGIIHTDPWLTNLIETPSGALYLIDWEDGGISYPLLDVGYALAFLCTFTARDRRNWDAPNSAEGLLARPDWARAFLSAYEAIRPLSVLERRLLRDAIHISFLAYMVEFDSGALILDNYRRMKLTGTFLLG